MSSLRSSNENKHINYSITGGVVLIDLKDYELIRGYKWSAQYTRRKNLYYAITTIQVGKYTRKRLIMHRIIMNAKEGELVDHINRNGLDNRRCNLRIVTPSQNAMNREGNKNTTSKYKGVCWKVRENKWQSYINKDGIKYHLGMFTNEVEGAIAYDLKAKELFGEFALLNFPESEES